MAMPKMRYFKCYPDNFLNGTAILNDEQCALYVRLFMYMYDQGGPVPFEVQKLKHVLHKRPQDIRRIVTQLVTLGKLSVDDENRLHNGRTDQMIEKWPEQWRANGASSHHSSERPERAKSAANTTHARAHANAGNPEARSHIRERSLSEGDNTARETESLSQVFARRLAEAKREERAKEIGHDETSNKG